MLKNIFVFSCVFLGDLYEKQILSFCWISYEGNWVRVRVLWDNSVRLISIRSLRPKPLGHLMKFTQRSVLYCSTLHFDEISKFLGISAQEIFM